MRCANQLLCRITHKCKFVPLHACGVRLESSLQGSAPHVLWSALGPTLVRSYSLARPSPTRYSPFRLLHTTQRISPGTAATPLDNLHGRTRTSKSVAALFSAEFQLHEYISGQRQSPAHTPVPCLQISTHDSPRNYQGTVHERLPHL